jgi:hypothetical protein
VLAVRKSTDDRADEHQPSHHRRLREREIDRDLTTVRAADDRRSRDAGLAQDGEQVVRLRVPARGHR